MAEEIGYMEDTVTTNSMAAGIEIIFMATVGMMSFTVRMVMIIWPAEMAMTSSMAAAAMMRLTVAEVMIPTYLMPRLVWTR